MYGLQQGREKTPDAPPALQQLLVVHVLRRTHQYIDLVKSGFEILPLEGFEYCRAKLRIRDIGIENETACLPQLTGGNVQILNCA
jgi:hypothetical protein